MTTWKHAMRKVHYLRDGEVRTLCGRNCSLNFSARKEFVTCRDCQFYMVQEDQKKLDSKNETLAKIGL